MVCKYAAVRPPQSFKASKTSRSSSLNRRNHCLPNKRSRNETWGGPSELSGVWQAARCLYDAGEPSWARSRCYSSARQPIQYTACVGLSHIFQKVTFKEKNHPPGLARDWSIYVRPRTDPWRGCGWCPRTAPLIIDIKRRSGTRGVQLCYKECPIIPHV